MDVTQRARLAIQRGEAWKADTMADLDEVANALRGGVAKSAGVVRVYWQPCDVLRVAKQHPETAADD